jgi:hypothetical protein
VAIGGGRRRGFFRQPAAGNPERSPLVRAGLIAETKRVNPAGKSKRPVLFLPLTEKGWAWCQEHMTWPRTRSIKVDTVLERLPRLGAVCRRGAAITSLGDFISKSNETCDAPSRLQAIRDACRALGNGEDGVLSWTASLNTPFFWPSSSNAFPRSTRSMNRCKFSQGSMPTN